MSNNEFSPEEIAKVKDRLEKLMRMAADASSPNEAAIAAARVKKLKDKYDLHDFEASGEIRDEFDSRAATRVYSAIPEHFKFFGVAIARYNDCQATFEQGENTHRAAAKEKRWARDGSSGKRTGWFLNFQGYKSDVDLACQMWDALNESVDRLCREYHDRMGYGRYNVRVGKTFKMGAVMEIIDRLKSMTAEREMLTKSAGTSLMIIKEVNVKEHFGDPKYTDRNMTKRLDTNNSENAHAFNAGRIAGSKVEIVRSVED